MIFSLASKFYCRLNTSFPPFVPPSLRYGRAGLKQSLDFARDVAKNSSRPDSYRDRCGIFPPLNISQAEIGDLEHSLS